MEEFSERIVNTDILFDCTDFISSVLHDFYPSSLSIPGYQFNEKDLKHLTSKINLDINEKNKVKCPEVFDDSESKKNIPYYEDQKNCKDNLHLVDLHVNTCIPADSSPRSPKQTTTPNSNWSGSSSPSTSSSNSSNSTPLQILTLSSSPSSEDEQSPTPDDNTCKIFRDSEMLSVVNNEEAINKDLIVYFLIDGSSLQNVYKRILKSKEYKTTTTADTFNEENLIKVANSNFLIDPFIFCKGNTKKPQAAVNAQSVILSGTVINSINKESIELCPTCSKPAKYLSNKANKKQVLKVRKLQFLSKKGNNNKENETISTPPPDKKTKITKKKKESTSNKPKSKKMTEYDIYSESESETEKEKEKESLTIDPPSSPSEPSPLMLPSITSEFPDLKVKASINCSGNPSNLNRTLAVNFEFKDRNGEVLWKGSSSVFRVQHHRRRRENYFTKEKDITTTNIEKIIKGKLGNKNAMEVDEELLKYFEN